MSMGRVEGKQLVDVGPEVQPVQHRARTEVTRHYSRTNKRGGSGGLAAVAMSIPHTAVMVMVVLGRESAP